MLKASSIRILALIVMTLLLASCGRVAKVAKPVTSIFSQSEAGDPLATARSALAAATPCCTQFSQFDYSTELPPKPHRFRIGPKRPVADFNGSHSWFLAFRLPEHKTPPYQVLLKSELSGRWLHKSYLFAPSIVVLDAGFRPMQKKDVQLCEYMGWTQTTSGAFGHFSVDSPAARYLVIYSSSQQLASSTYWEQSPTAFSADAPVKMTSSGSFQIPHGPNGALYVGLLTDRFRSSVNNALCGKPKSSSGGVLSNLLRAVHRNGNKS